MTTSLSDSIPTILGIVSFVGIPLFAVIAVVVGRRRDAARVEALRAVAARWNMTFAPVDMEPLGWFGGYAFYHYGALARLSSVMRGTVDGAWYLLFDYETRVGPRNNHVVRMTVSAFDRVARPLPVFEATGGRHDAFTRMIDKLLPTKVVDFSDDPEFARTFQVVGEDVPALRAVFNPEARAFLLRRREWIIRSNGRWLLMSWHGSRPKPSEAETFANETVDGMRLLTK